MTIDKSVYTTPVVGVTFDDRQQVVSSLVSGETLRLRREPHNLHDPNAVRVERLNGQQVGYINRELAGQISLALDQMGGLAPATVVEMTGGGLGHNCGVVISFDLSRQSTGETEPSLKETETNNHSIFNQDCSEWEVTTVLGSYQGTDQHLDIDEVMNARLAQMKHGDAIRAGGSVHFLGYGEDGIAHFEVESDSHNEPESYHVQILIQGRMGVRCLGYDENDDFTNTMHLKGEPKFLPAPFKMYSGQDGMVPDGMVIAECKCKDFGSAAYAVSYANAKMRRGTRGIDSFILDDLAMCKHTWAVLGQNAVPKGQEVICNNSVVRAQKGYVIKAFKGLELRCYFGSVYIEEIRRMRINEWVFSVTSSNDKMNTKPWMMTNKHPLNWL